ncbi:MAG: hypothetical protein K0U60_07775 [Actinomycetia bacterium]|nr:hypothetical protein [Actinomycetes bacterium]MCH9801511.1 hypothetical protein [Actinomycetes bacterium]
MRSGPDGCDVAQRDDVGQHQRDLLIMPTSGGVHRRVAPLLRRVGDDWI